MISAREPDSAVAGLLDEEALKEEEITIKEVNLVLMVEIQNTMILTARAGMPLLVYEIYEETHVKSFLKSWFS